MIARFFIAIGAPLVAFVRYLGELVLLAGDTFRSAIHSPIALALVPPANCRDRLVITSGRDGDRRLHWRRFRCPNLFSI